MGLGRGFWGGWGLGVGGRKGKGSEEEMEQEFLHEPIFKEISFLIVYARSRREDKYDDVTTK